MYRGVLNIVHGTHDTVNRILDHKDIKAISFVGSDAAGRYIYERGSASGKRVQVRTPSCVAYGHLFSAEFLSPSWVRNAHRSRIATFALMQGDSGPSQL